MTRRQKTRCRFIEVCSRDVESTPFVQQPCSNPSRSPEMLGKASTRKSAYLQGFCKLQKPLAKYRAAFARRRSGVRSPSLALSILHQLQGKGRRTEGTGRNTWSS